MNVTNIQRILHDNNSIIIIIIIMLYVDGILVVGPREFPGEFTKRFQSENDSHCPRVFTNLSLFSEIFVYFPYFERNKKRFM
jgi:hypothetical protein